MADPELVFVQGDTAPDISAVIHVKGDPTTPINLTGATVRFQMRLEDDRSYQVDAPAVVDVDPTTGGVSFQWGANDLDRIGDFLCQWEVTFADLRIQTTAKPNIIRVRRQ